MSFVAMRAPLALDAILFSFANGREDDLSHRLARIYRGALQLVEKYSHL